MKITHVLVALSLAVCGSITMADILMPNTTVIDGTNAQTLMTNITEVTGQKPGSFNGREIVSAKATISCSSYQGKGQACKIEIEK